MSKAEALPPLARRASARPRPTRGRSAKGASPLLVAARRSPGPLHRLLARGADRGAQRPDARDAVTVGTLDDQNDVMAALH